MGADQLVSSLDISTLGASFSVPRLDGSLDVVLTGFGEPIAQELDVMWAPGHLPPLSGRTGFDLAGALELQLGLGDLAPGLANAQLMLQMQQRPSITAGRLVLVADLVLSTPPP